MANERIMLPQSPLDEKLHNFALQLLREGHTMDAVITSLQALKVEMAIAMKYQQAVSDAAYKP